MIIGILIVLLAFIGARLLTVIFDRHLLLEEIHDHVRNSQVKANLLCSVKPAVDVLLFNPFYHTEISLFDSKIAYFKFISYRLQYAKNI